MKVFGAMPCEGIPIPQRRGTCIERSSSPSRPPTVGTTIASVTEIALIVAAAVDEQGTSTQGISRNAMQAARVTSQIATNISDAGRGARKTGSASAQMLASAQSLASESNHLKIEVDRFLASVARLRVHNGIARP
jgi:hypothetical protein